MALLGIGRYLLASLLPGTTGHYRVKYSCYGCTRFAIHRLLLESLPINLTLVEFGISLVVLPDL